MATFINWKFYEQDKKYTLENILGDANSKSNSNWYSNFK